MTQNSVSYSCDLSADLPRPRCRHCGDVIGVYEPVVVQTDDGERQTSLAAEPGLSADERCFHGECFAALREFAGA